LNVVSDHRRLDAVLTHAIQALPLPALVALVAICVVGGIVKGVTGIGMPLIIIPLATLFLDVPAAVGLLTVPMIATNIGQALEGGRTWPAIRQLGSLLGAFVVGTLIGVHLLIHIDRRLLSAILGVTFIGLAALLLSMPRLRLSRRTERWAAPVVGLCAGVIGGMSAMFGPPLIAYQVGLDANPHIFVKHMAIIAFTASLTLLLALGSLGSLSLADLIASAAAIIPIQLGMPLGRWLRRRIKPAVFRRGILLVLALSGIDMLRRAFL
jgi:uncharacterized protein